MSSVNKDPDSPGNSQFHIYDIQAELISESWSYLQVHDQVSMKRVCKWWRINLSSTFLSRLVDIDISRMVEQSGDFLKQTLNLHVQKNTKVLVVRHNIVEIKGVQQSDIIARVIKEKHADLIQLTLKGCEVQFDLSTCHYYYIHPECIYPCVVIGLTFSTRKLVLENYTIRDALSNTLSHFRDEMPCHIKDQVQFLENLPQIVLDRVVLESTQPFQQHYHSFIVALNSNCPEMSPEDRSEVVQLYNSWRHCNANQRQWTSLNNIIKCLNEGVPVNDYEDPSVDVSALRHLDLLTLNKLTMEALYRLYF